MTDKSAKTLGQLHELLSALFADDPTAKCWQWRGWDDGEIYAGPIGTHEDKIVIRPQE